MINKNFIKGVPPEWLYPLYKPVDRRMFRDLIQVARTRKKPKVAGTPKEINQFIKLLVVSTKLKKWRTFVLPVVEGLKKGMLDAPQLVAKGSRFKMKKGIDRSWAVYTQDERLCLAIDKFSARRVHYVGTKGELVEFVGRFLLTELLQDWRGPKMMVAMESVKGKTVRLNRLNRLLALWDFTGVFTKV